MTVANVVKITGYETLWDLEMEEQESKCVAAEHSESCPIYNVDAHIIAQPSPVETGYNPETN
jgi:hypothetical protein